MIVAINNDPKAPIFEFSDYGLVADLYDAIPVLTEAIKQLNRD
jgi:electron transfer flavoprotein alpha subunit